MHIIVISAKKSAKARISRVNISALFGIGGCIRSTTIAALEIH